MPLPESRRTSAVAVNRRWALLPEGATEPELLDVANLGQARDAAIERVAFTGRPVVIMSGPREGGRLGPNRIIMTDILRLPFIAASIRGGLLP